MTTEKNPAAQGGQRSAEQLAIALMAEARKLYRVRDNGGEAFYGEVAERLAQWATDVRQLGVNYFTETSMQRAQMWEFQEQRDEARESLAICNDAYGKLDQKLARVRKLVGRVSPYDRPVVITAQVRDILEALDE